MMEFIVLGQVPGTHMIITFSWVLLAALAGVLSLNYYIRKSRTASDDKQPKQLELL